MENQQTSGNNEAAQPVASNALLDDRCDWCDGAGRIGIFGTLDHCPACRKNPSRLKTWPEYFQAVWDGRKTFEVRDARDRGFSTGDLWILDEWDLKAKEYTGREIMIRITYLTDFGQKPGFIVFAFEKVYAHSRSSNVRDDQCHE